MARPPLDLAVEALTAAVTPPAQVRARVSWAARDPGELAGLTLVAGIEAHSEYGYRSAGGMNRMTEQVEPRSAEGYAPYQVPPAAGISMPLTAVDAEDPTSGPPADEPRWVEVVLPLPVTQPSVKRDVFCIRHAVRVDIVDGSSRIVQTARAPFRVLLARDGYPYVEHAAPEPAGPDIGLSVDVTNRAVRPGEHVRGSVTLPRDAAVKTLRVHLVRSAYTSNLGQHDHADRFDDEVFTVRLEPDSGPRWAFTLPVPADADPTCFTGPFALRWFVRARAARSRAPWAVDSTCDVELNLYNG